MIFKRFLKKTAVHAGLLCALLLTGISLPGHAAVPDTINYQGYLTNTDGSPVDGSVTITFAAYNVDLGGVPLWNQTDTVAVEQGLFSVALANPVNPFPAGLFDGPVYIGLFVAGEELLPRRALTANAYAFKAADADTLEGASAADLDQSADVAALQGDLGTAQSDIANLGTSVTSNDTRITALEGSAGDITGVAAGAGLAGGGLAGNVLLSVGDNAITGAMIADGNVGPLDLGPSSVTSTAIADGAVTSLDIQDGSITPADIDADNTNVFQLRGLDVGAGGLRIESSADLLIFDDFHGLRWYSQDGSTQTGSITVRESGMVMNHNGQDREIFRSNVFGVGFAGAVPTSGYAATVPSLRVVNSIDLGYEVVSANYVMDVAVTQCHSHGNLPCFIGEGTASCPTGKRVLGGGLSGLSARYGASYASHPVGQTGWRCNSSYDLANNTRTCYAICARVE